MSVEQLIERSDEKSLNIAKSLIQKEQKSTEDKNVDRSPAYIVANAYISEAQEKLKEISGKLDEKHIEIASHKDLVRKMIPGLRSTFEMNAAGLWMGITLHEFENILVTRTFAIKHLVDEYNFAVTGTHLGLAKPEDTTPDKVEDAKWRQLIQYSTKDRSLGNFFTEGFEFLPESLRYNLKESGILPIITGKLVPAYTEQVNALINANSTRPVPPNEKQKS